MPATIADVPRIMRAKGWTVGARLMEHWMSLAESTAPPFTNRNDDIVTMRWVLGYPRAKEVYDAILAERIWASDAARPVVRRMLERNGLLGGIGKCFGVFQSTQGVIHANAVNYRSVRQRVWSDLDDLAAALANFNFHVQIGGSVAPLGEGRHRVTVEMVGIYVRDQYDFTGDQSLGYWDAGTNEVRRTPWPGFTELTNASYRAWRSTTRRGGDFEVFSDVSVVPLARPTVFEI